MPLQIYHARSCSKLVHYSLTFFNFFKAFFNKEFCKISKLWNGSSGKEIEQLNVTEPNISKTADSSEGLNIVIGPNFCLNSR